MVLHLRLIAEAGRHDRMSARHAVTIQKVKGLATTHCSIEILTMKNS